MSLREQHVDLRTGQGVMDIFVVHPEGAGPFRVVLFYTDSALLPARCMTMTPPRSAGASSSRCAARA